MAKLNLPREVADTLDNALNLAPPEDRSATDQVIVEASRAICYQLNEVIYAVNLVREAIESQE
jgi:hypothetical protein